MSQAILPKAPPTADAPRCGICGNEKQSIEVPINAAQDAVNTYRRCTHCDELCRTVGRTCDVCGGGMKPLFGPYSDTSKLIRNKKGPGPWS